MQINFVLFFKGGIDKKHLLLASEPEAAAIYCISLPREQQELMNNIGQPGHKFLTVDIGGITIISSQEL